MRERAVRVFVITELPVRRRHYPGKPWEGRSTTMGRLNKVIYITNEVGEQSLQRWMWEVGGGG